MAVHRAAAAPAVGKRLWSYVRAALFMARNGVLSHKRRLLLSMHLLAANKRKAVECMRTVTNLLSVSHYGGHHGHHGNSTAYALRRPRGQYEYEFSCSNSPAAEDHHSSSSRRRLAYFPCLGAVAEHESHEDGYDADAEPAPPVARITYYASSDADDDAASASPAPGDEEEEYAYACASAAAAGGVDADAEEFIRRFYDQLRRQNTVAAAAQLLPYHHAQQQESAIAAA